MTIPLLTHHWRAVIAFAAENEPKTATFMPVPISVGLPRNVSWARSLPRAKEITPYGLLRKPPLSADEFAERFEARMEKAGVSAITARFEAIYRAYQKPLVLLCWEPSGEPCHRRQFAEWWERQTGQRVPEAEGLDPLSITKGIAEANK